MKRNIAILKIKIKHLAVEPSIIRKEEKKFLKRANWCRKQQLNVNANDFYWSYENLRSHRTHDVRSEARATQLAYAFLRGKKYYNTEASCNKNLVYLNKDVNSLYWISRTINIITKYRIGEYAIMSEKNAKEKITTDFINWLNGK